MLPTKRIHIYACTKKGHFLKFISYVNFTGIVFGHNSPVNKQMKLWWHQCNSKEISKKKNDVAQTVKKIMKKNVFRWYLQCQYS